MANVFLQAYDSHGLEMRNIDCKTSRQTVFLDNAPHESDHSDLLIRNAKSRQYLLQAITDVDIVKCYFPLLERRMLKTFARVEINFQHSFKTEEDRRKRGEEISQ